MLGCRKVTLARSSRPEYRKSIPEDRHGPNHDEAHGQLERQFLRTLIGIANSIAEIKQAMKQMGMNSKKLFTDDAEKPPAAHTEDRSVEALVREYHRMAADPQVAGD